MNPFYCMALVIGMMAAAERISDPKGGLWPLALFLLALACSALGKLQP